MIRLVRIRRVAVTILFLSIVIAGAVFILVRHISAPESDQNGESNVPLVDQKTLSVLPHKSASSADISHIASGLVPPTNMWLSGMVLQQTPQPVYPLPISFLAKDSGFEVGLPTVSSTATEIDGEHVPGITADLGATSFQLTLYDKLSATLTYRSSSQTLGNLTVTEGSPFVFYTPATTGSIVISDINQSDILEHSAHYVRYNRAGHTYVISSDQGTIGSNAGSLSIAVAKDELVSMYALPTTTDVLKPYAPNAIRSVAVSHTQSGNSISTAFAYTTTNGKQTVFTVLPYQTIQGKDIADYPSVYGQMKTLVGTSFTTTTMAVNPSDELDLSKLTDAQRNQLVISLAGDVATTKVDQQDSYYAGKQLARAANLLSIAEQLHQADSVNKLKTILNDAFRARLGTNYFYYDTTLRGIAATNAAFGSEDFNDHHFHYGYWLYAGSIMAGYDSSFISTYGKQLNLLAADIASYQSSSQFPLYRNYDPYTGHGWAAGLSPFADGNNQESSSEAIHAWNGVSLWGQVTKNTELERMGQWMLANESNTAANTWRSVNTSDKALANYTSPVVGIAFAGKRTYSTFFSAEPAAKLGIQLVPMDPSMASFADDKAAITTAVNATIQNDDYNVPLGDYILMYEALADPTKAASLASKQTVIDDGNSSTYLNAWIYTR